MHEISDTNLQSHCSIMPTSAECVCKEISAVVAKIGELGDTTSHCTMVLPTCAQCVTTVKPLKSITTKKCSD